LKLSSSDFTSNIVHITKEEEHETQGGRGSAHHVQSIEKRQVSVNIVGVKNFECQNHEWQTLVEFECRQCEIVDFQLGGGFHVKAGDTIFLGDDDSGENIGEDEDGWFSVDDSGDSVSIENLEVKIVPPRGDAIIVFPTQKRTVQY